MKMKVVIRVMEERRCASCDKPVRGKASPYQVEDEMVFLCSQCEAALKRKQGPRKGVEA